jgi:hypothetical protein
MKSGRCPNRFYDMYRVKSFERWPAFLSSLGVWFFLIATNAGEDSDLIGLLALRGQARHAGTPLIEESLDVALFERDQGRASIDHAADRGIMAFPKSRNPEGMAEGVVGHGRSNVTSKKSNGRAKHTGAETCREVPTYGSHQPFDTLSTTIIETPRSNVFADLDLTVSYIRCIISIFMLRITPIIKSSIC